MRNRLYIFGAILMMISACSKDASKSGSSSEAHQDSYQFIENGCDTKKHAFSSVSARTFNRSFVARLKTMR